MQMPTYAPSILRSKEDIAGAILLIDEGPIQPANGWLPGWLDPGRYACCASACAGREGFGACVATCQANGNVCDAGTRNCSGIC
jgi:hypothetical protein